MTDETKCLLGQYYTPPEVVDLIFALCLATYPKNTLSLLDPCVGKGIFPERLNCFLDSLPFLKEVTGLCLDVDHRSIESTQKKLYGLNLRGSFEFRQEDFFFLKPSPIFDLIISNPPYLRQEIHSAFIKEHLRQDLENKLRLKLSKRVDLYVYFFLYSYFFLNDCGRIGFISSNSFLSAAYGRPLQRFLQDHFKILFIVDSKIERFFSDAAINACITILEKCASSLERAAHQIKFIQFFRPLKEIFHFHTTEHWSSLLEFSNLASSTKTNLKTSSWRIRKVEQRSLESHNSPVSFSAPQKRWNIYLRAPKLYFDILKSSGDKLIPLTKIAQVKRGIRTGANDFFYQKTTSLQHFSDADLKFFKPLIKSSKDLKSIFIRPRDISWSAFSCSIPKKDLNDSLLNFIEKAENSGLNKRMDHSRKLWYYLNLPSPAPLLLSQILSNRFIIFLNKANAIADQRLIEINPFKKEETDLIAAILNSTVSHLFLELIGRTQLGEGGLGLPASDISQLTILNPSKINFTEKRSILNAFKALLKRPIYKIPKELSYKDRQTLDSIVLGLLTQETKLSELYSVFTTLVQNRLSKAKLFFVS
ncbi:MAG: Eco57I restriction-modification methylase domain-containing protein [Promethearchaeota archaeon]